MEAVASQRRRARQGEDDEPPTRLASSVLREWRRHLLENICADLLTVLFAGQVSEISKGRGAVRFWAVAVENAPGPSLGARVWLRVVDSEADEVVR